MIYICKDIFLLSFIIECQFTQTFMNYKKIRGGLYLSEYINPSEFYYSEIFPNGIYAHYAGECTYMPIPDSLSKTQTTPMVKNVLSHGLYFCKKVYISSDGQKKILISEILNPSTTLASWPVDLIRIDGKEENRDNFEPVDLKHLYCDEYHNIEEKPANYAILFPYEKRASSGRGGYAYYVSLDNWLKSVPINQRNYENNQIKKICLNICRAIADFNREGYLYFDFSLSRFMVLSDLKVVPEYTNLLMNKCSIKKLTAKYGLVPLDFVVPHLYFKYNDGQNESQRSPDDEFNIETQNYSLAAMLFYLMFGRKPYEGQRLMQNHDDESDPVKHYAYLKNFYLKDENIDFIFDDSHENQNLLVDDYTDIFSTDIRLWNECPKELQEMFGYVLQRQNALRDPYVRAPKADSWVDIFEKLGWGT